MKKSKSFNSFLALSLVTIVVLLVALKLFYKMNTPKVITPELSYSLTPAKTDLKVGEKVSVPVYLTGADAAKTTAFDVKFYYDTTKFKLTNITPNGFFEKYITVKWDQKESWFALALTPSNPKTEVKVSEPLLTLELTAIGKSTLTPVSTGTSLVYLTKIGGFHPEMGTVNFSIK